MPAYSWQTDPFGYMGDNSPNFIAAGQPEYARGELNNEASRIQQGGAPTYNPILAQGFNTTPVYDINKGQSYGEFLARETARTQAGANSGPYTNNPTLNWNFLNQNSTAIPTGPFRLPTYQDPTGINYAIRAGTTQLPSWAVNATPNWQQLIGGGAAGWGNPGAPTFQPGQNIFQAPPAATSDKPSSTALTGGYQPAYAGAAAAMANNPNYPSTMIRYGGASNLNVSDGYEVNPNPVPEQISRGAPFRAAAPSEETDVIVKNRGFDDPVVLDPFVEIGSRIGDTGSGVGVWRGSFGSGTGVNSFENFLTNTGDIVTLGTFTVSENRVTETISETPSLPEPTPSLSTFSVWDGSNTPQISNTGQIVTLGTFTVSEDKITDSLITISITPAVSVTNPGGIFDTPQISNTGPIVTLGTFTVSENRETTPAFSTPIITISTPSISINVGTPQVTYPATTPAATTPSVSVSINPFTPSLSGGGPATTPSVTGVGAEDWWRNYLREGKQSLSDLNELFPGMLDLYTKASQGYSQSDADRLAALSGAGGRFASTQGNLNDLANQQTIAANSALRAGNLEDAKKLADQANQLRKQANPDLYAAMEQFQGAAGGQVSNDLARLQQAQARQLSPEDIRNAQQAAREAYSARGLVMGPGAIGAEILNRENLARQREQEARTNLAQSMGQLYQGIGARTANVFDPLAATLGQQYGMQTQNIGMTSNLMNQLGQLAAGGYGNQYVQNQYNPFNPYAQDVYNTNFNARAAQQLAAANNAAALEAARIQAAAAKSAGETSVLGQVGSAILPNILKALPIICWVAREVYGEDNHKWLLFRHWVINHASDSFRNWYMANGEAFAEWLKRNPWAKPAIRAFMDSKINSLNQAEIVNFTPSHAL